MATTIVAPDETVAEAAVASPDPVQTDPVAAPSVAEPRPEPAWLPVGRPVEAFVDDIELVAPGGRIYIFCGEAHPFVYNDPRFLDAVCQAHRDRHAQIEVITGPILLVPEGRQQTNGLLMLWKDGAISALYHRRARYATGHFRVVETDLETQKAFRFYSEAPHRPLQPIEQRTCENLSRLHPSDVHERARQAISLFNSWKSQVTQHGDPTYRNLPLLTTPSELSTLVAEATDRGRVFKYLDETELYETLPSGHRLLTPYPDYRLTMPNGTFDGPR